jgi:hypothetical protein
MGNVILRSAVERAIAIKTIRALLDAGFLITVNTDGDDVLQFSGDLHAIYSAMFEFDECFLRINGAKGKPFAWVYFIFGNDGWDVISDYTVNIEQWIKPVNDWADILSPDEGTSATKKAHHIAKVLSLMEAL